MGKLYGKNTIDQVTTKIKGDDDTKRKLQVFGLFREQDPFKSTGDITRLTDKPLLDDLYDEWYDTIINKLIKTPEFINNSDKASRYLDAYANNITKLDNPIPFSISKLDKTTVEKAFIDVINNNNWLGDVRKKSQDETYETKDVIYRDNDVIILNTDSKAKCIKYGSDTTWCITKPDQNYYNTYRLNHGATIYFVIQPNIPEPEDKIAVMVYGQGEYAVADRTNRGNRTGSKLDVMNFDELASQFQNMEGKENYFAYKKPSQEEIKLSEMLKQKITDTDITSVIKTKVKGLVVNGSEVEAHDCLVNYVAAGNNLTDEQVDNIDDQSINALIEAGYKFFQHDNWNTRLSENQKRRSAKLAQNNNIIHIILSYAPKPELSIPYFKDRFGELDKNSIRYILAKTNKPELFIPYFKDRFGELDKDDIRDILINTHKPELFIPYFKDRFGELGMYDMSGILKFTPKPELFIPYFKDILGELDKNHIRDILTYTFKPELFIPYFKDKFGEFNKDDIRYVLAYTFKPEEFIPYFKDRFVELSKDNIIGILAKTLKSEYLRGVFFDMGLLKESSSQLIISESERLI